MEVKLKKTKITKSILDQSFKGSWDLFYNWEGYDILGFCFYNKILTPILYKRVTNQVIVMDSLIDIKQIELKKETVQIPDSNYKNSYLFPLKYRIYIHFPNYKYPIPIFTQNEESDEQVEDMVQKIKIFVNTLKSKGQFYI